MSESREVIVVGAGHNGLVCAAYLAQAGRDVLVLERSAVVGGACVTQELLPGYRFSTFSYGAHGPGPKICRDLEIPAEAFRVAAMDPSLVQLFPDGDRIVLWKDPAKTEDELARFGPGEVLGFRRYRDWSRRALRICQDFFLESAPNPIDLRQKWTQEEDAAVLDLLLTGSLWDVLCQFFDNEKVRAAFARADDPGPSTAVGSALADFVEAASTGLGIRNEAGIPEGGMGQVTAALAQRVRAYGGEIREGCPVRQIRVEAGRATGIILESGDFIAAGSVISNADPKRTFLKLIDPDQLDPSFHRQVSRLKTEAGYMKWLGVLGGLPRFRSMRAEEQDQPRFAGAVRILPLLQYMEQAWQQSRMGKLPHHPILSLQMPTAYWPHQAPPGKHILGAWLRWAPAHLSDGSGWDERRQEMQDRIIQILDDYAPGLAELVEWSRLYTPLDIERETGITGASIRHLDMTLDQMLHRRPLPAWRHYRSPVDGLWLCGSGTHPCGSVTGAPGHNSAAAFLRRGAAAEIS